VEDVRNRSHEAEAALFLDQRGRDIVLALRFLRTARWRREGWVSTCEISNLDFDTILRIVRQELAPIP
jgi:hypothetical protein